MAIFPRIQSPCPYKGDLAAIVAGDFCRLCKREVFDLNAMTDVERVDLLANCQTEVCVSYRLTGMAAAVALTAGALAAPASAAAQAAPTPELVDVEYIIVGGISDLDNIEFVQVEADPGVPELPVEFEAPPPEGGGQ
jgi:predicted Fe-S protein YdhL (DUF1289 family)